MVQTRLVSFVEALVNTVIGFFLSFLIWPFASYILDMPYTVSSHIGVVLIFTVASVARGYVIRRFFNSQLRNLSIWLSKKLSGDKS